MSDVRKETAIKVPAIIRYPVRLFFTVLGYLLPNVAASIFLSMLQNAPRRPLKEAEKKFQAWLDEKAAKVEAKKDGLAKADADAKAKALEAEKAVNDARVAAAAPVVEEEVAEDAPEADAAEATNEEE